MLEVGATCPVDPAAIFSHRPRLAFFGLSLPPKRRSKVPTDVSQDFETSQRPSLSATFPTSCLPLAVRHPPIHTIWLVEADPSLPPFTLPMAHDAPSFHDPTKLTMTPCPAWVQFPRQTVDVQTPCSMVIPPSP